MSTPSTLKRSAGRALGTVVGLAGVGAALVLAVLLIAGSSLNPFRTTTTERQDSVVMARIQDLARFEAASGRFTTIVDQQTDTKLPSWATGNRVVLDAEGDVAATVDLSHLPTDAVELSADGRSATVHVPAPVLQPPRLDPDSTRVIARQQGVLNRVGAALSGSDPVDDQSLYQRAAEKLTDAAAGSDLQDRARANTERFLDDTLHAAGVTDVTVVFDASVPGQSA
jgi:hypothetical protein